MGAEFTVPLEAAGVVGGVLLLMCLAACISVNLPRRQRMFTPAELDQIRIRREEEKEALLEDQIQLLESKKRLHIHNRTLLTARAQTERMIEGSSAGDVWEAKGRAVYGEAWDNAVDGQLPLRDLFNLPAEEIHSAKLEAAQRVQSGTHKDNAPPLSVRQHKSAATTSGSSSRLLTARAHREHSSKPLSGAAFDDARFVTPRNGQQQQQQQYVSNTGTAANSPANVSDRTASVSNSSKRTTDNSSRNGGLPLYSVQAPGLSRPAPPSVPYIDMHGLQSSQRDVSVTLSPATAADYSNNSSKNDSNSGRLGSARRTTTARIAP